ncbi:hypothetical protein [Sphingobium sp. DC-2]|uniref:hypothetical protein n=1 Tax=Sphingobium sp. DC-2 TaxID=1303256 RepID=UPI0004C2D2CD|nr:hypothetical protein [Sphingobium sp. DC-2]
MTSMDMISRPDKLVADEAKAARPRDPLPRLLAQLTARAGEPAGVARAASRPWASALFQGRRHVVTLRLSGGDAPQRARRFCQGIEETEWTLPGQFVADISIDETRSDGDGEWIELSALTIEEW